MRYAPLLVVLIGLVLVMVGPGARSRTARSILITVGGLLLLAIFLALILFKD